MRPETTDRLGIAAASFVRRAAEGARLEAAEALLCLSCGSTHGVRRHLTSLREFADRRARIERHLLRRSSRAARLRRAADAALRALDSGSPAKLTRALDRVETLAQPGAEL
jgi:ribosomal protein S12 methylthiotransferase accessory factor YcaO